MQAGEELSAFSSVEVIGSYPAALGPKRLNCWVPERSIAISSHTAGQLQDQGVGRGLAQIRAQHIICELWVP